MESIFAVHSYIFFFVVVVVSGRFGSMLYWNGAEAAAVCGFLGVVNSHV